jgi:RimJ/RimL family protein N-acetyltransferase
VAYGWEGEKTRLVPLERERHFENALRWVNDPELTAWTLVGDLPVARLAEERWFDKLAAESPNEVAFAVETLDTNEHIGFASLHQIDWRDRFAHTGTIIGRRDLWGRGYGGDAVRARTRYAFEVLNLRLLVSRVFAENAASLRMLARAGYREAGRVPRHHWKRGAYRDIVILVAERERV